MTPEEIIFQNHPHGICKVSREGRFLVVNDWLCEYWGYSRDKLLSMTFQEITHPADLRPDVNQVDRLIRGEIENYRMSKRYRHGKTGKWLWSVLCVGGVRNSSNELEYFISQIAPDTDTGTDEQKRYLQQIRTAIATDQLELHYQPIVLLRTGEVVGYEALSRWQHPERGLLMPKDFIPDLARADALDELSEWVIGKVSLIQPQIKAYISFNVDPSTVGKTSWASMSSKINLRSRLEITENQKIEPPVLGKLLDLKELGYHLVADDWGSGWCNYIVLDWATGLKIDGSLTKDVHLNTHAWTRVSSIAMLARGHGMDVVAEMIKSQEQAVALRRAGCDFGQGELFGLAEPL